MNNAVTDSIFVFPEPTGEKWVCEAPDCFVVFKRGEGGRRSDAKTCSSACRKRVQRRGAVPALAKVDEANIRAARLQRDVEELLERAKNLSLAIDALAEVATVARMTHVDKFLKELRKKEAEQ